MRFLADENMPGGSISALRDLGHDVVWVREAAPGSLDPDVIAWAMREARVLVTFDKDFGELAFAARLPATCGIILFRIPMPPPDEAGERIAALISAHDDWAGQFSVVEPSRVRRRPLPPPSAS